VARVLAAIDASAVAGPVLDETQLLADALGATPDAIHVGRGDPAECIGARAGVPVRTLHGDVVSTIVREASADDVEAVVVGARGLPGARHSVGHVTGRLLRRLPKLVAVVPPDHRPAKLQHVLVPLDGSIATGSAVTGLVDTFTRHGAELVVVHVFTPETIPSTLDHTGALELWEEEFVRRTCPRLADARVAVCIGPPGTKIAEAARAEATDLVVLAWRRRFTGRHGQVVLDALAHAGAPVLLVPIDTCPARPLEVVAAANGFGGM